MIQVMSTPWPPGLYSLTISSSLTHYVGNKDISTKVLPIGYLVSGHNEIQFTRAHKHQILNNRWLSLQRVMDARNAVNIGKVLVGMTIESRLP